MGRGVPKNPWFEDFEAQQPGCWTCWRMGNESPPQTKRPPLLRGAELSSLQVCAINNEAKSSLMDGLSVVYLNSSGSFHRI